MTTLVYSDGCTYCNSILEMLYSHPEVRSIVRLHNIHTSGVPNGITRVPSLVVGSEVLVGGDAKRWLERYTDHATPEAQGSGLGYVCLDGSETPCQSGVCIMDTSAPKSAPMTKEFQEKMKQKVG